MKRIVTHNGPFHTDDVMAVAALELMLERSGESYEVVRTRDPETWRTGDFVVDVGGTYEPESRRYDHHQKGGAGERTNGVPYSSIGLVWKHHGRTLVESDAAWAFVDEKLIQPLDLADNGKLPHAGPTEEGVSPYTLDSVVFAYYPEWDETATFDERFHEAVAFAKRLLGYECHAQDAKVSSERIIRKAYEDAPDKRIVLLDKFYPSKHVIREFPEPLYVVYPTFDGSQWGISAVKKEEGSFELRKSLPAAWAGKSGADLQSTTGVSDAQFCHNGRFVAFAKSREGAMAMAVQAAEA